ncbi:MAG: MBL fold metallo-hydrolase, partial [Chloroflexi bacterium]|nr:MBL fold metallo-hydrolase [Chloroflexota bacterium]
MPCRISASQQLIFRCALNVSGAPFTAPNRTRPTSRRARSNNAALVFFLTTKKAYGMAECITIDTNHLGRSGVIACYLIRGSVPILVDPGPTVVLPTIESALADHNLRLADIGAILLTHIHLDHAGAVGSIVAAHPHIKVYVHHRGAPHLIDPSKLLNSATRIYGDMMATLWGDFLAIPAANLHILHGGEHLHIGDQHFTVHDAPGHAVHHVMYHWNK